MKQIITSLFILSLMLSVHGSDASAQDQMVFKLNSIIEADRIPGKNKAIEEVLFEINNSAFEHPDFVKGSLVEFEDVEGNPTLFELTSVNSFTSGTTSIHAKSTANPDEQIIATYSNGRLNGLWYPYDKPVIKIGFDKVGGKGKLSLHSDHKGLECGVDHNMLVSTADINFNKKFYEKSKSAAFGANSAPILTASEDDSITIDLMIVYTDEAETWATDTSSFGSIEAVIAQSINLSQTALTNSELEIELRLVNTTKVNYNEMLEEDAGVHLRRITQNPSDPIFESEFDGYLENVHTIRDQVGADVVAFFIWTNDTGGIGWRLGSTRGSDALAFNLNRIQQVGSDYTLIHEIGHNMGNAHSRTQSNARADETGGLFHYSAGYQNTSDSFHTIMAYSDGFVQAPLFSSPDLSFQGEPAGTNNARTPENNALSMAQIKRVFASYRPTLTNSPEGNVSTNQLEVDINLEESVTIPIDITNTGSSPLVWSVDFRFPSALKAKNSTSAETIAPADLSAITKRPFNYSKLPLKGKVAQEDVLYSSTFETTENFETGTYNGYNEWRSISGSSFIISNSNANSGDQHLRLQYDGNGTNFVSAPFLGYQIFGTYEITVNFSISSQEETYDIYLLDGNNGEFSGGVIMAPSQQGGFLLYAATPGEPETSFSSTPANVTTGEYHELRILISPFDQEVKYYFNDQLIAANPYTGGYSPGELLFLHRNTTPGTTYDIDDIEIRKIDSPYRWLTVTTPTGVTFEASSSTLELDFSSVGVPAGEYDTDLVISTNDPDNSTIRIPITLTVANVVSNETEDTPETISLDQNYPNPFNPATTISYSLNAQSEVLLEVFSIHGKKVATLERGLKTEGKHVVSFDASGLSSGIYIYRLQSAGQTLTRQMVLIK